MSGKYPIKRLKNSNNFKYFWKNGSSVTDKNTIDRIKKLRIPPAYTDVKIYNSNAKVQATGLDDRKRKQYRYHPSWVEERGRKKFRGLISFAEAYPVIVRKINNSLKGNAPSNKEELVALATGVLNICRIRPGSIKHLRDTGSFGTTTLLKKHVQKDKNSNFLLVKFMGKSHVLNECKVNLNTIIGKSLYKQVNTKKNNNEPIFSLNGVMISPDDINKFLQEIGGRKVSAKAFRTYHANARFITGMLPAIPKMDEMSMTARKKYTNEVIKKLAEELHHTPATFKNSYLFPPLREMFIDKPEEFKKYFYKKDIDEALIGFIKKKTAKSPQTPKNWR